MSDPSWWARTRRWLTVAPLLEILSGWTRRLIGNGSQNKENPGENEESEEPDLDPRAEA